MTNNAPVLIAAIRAATNLSTKEIAGRLRTTDVTLLRWEKGEFVPRRKAASRLARLHARVVVPEAPAPAVAPPTSLVPLAPVVAEGDDGAQLIGLVVPHVQCAECGTRSAVEHYLQGGEFGKLVGWRMPKGWARLVLPNGRAFALCTADAARAFVALPKVAASLVEVPTQSHAS